MPKAKTASKKRRIATKSIVRQRLLSLPAEIRTLIWEYVIGGAEPAKDKIDPTKTAFVDISTPDFKNHTRFIYTCRQIYNETHLMFYHRQQLLFPLNNTPESHLKLLHFASRINPRAHRFVGFETCWILNHALGGVRQLTDEERCSFQTLWLQMASIGWTRRLFVRRRPDAFPKAFVDKVADEHQIWGARAYNHNLVKRYLFRMLLRHVRTEYLRRPAVVALWVFIVKPNSKHEGAVGSLDPRV